MISLAAADLDYGRCAGRIEAFAGPQSPLPRFVHTVCRRMRPVCQAPDARAVRSEIRTLNCFGFIYEWHVNLTPFSNQTPHRLVLRRCVLQYQTFRMNPISTYFTGRFFAHNTHRDFRTFHRLMRRFCTRYPLFTKRSDQIRRSVSGGMGVGGVCVSVRAMRCDAVHACVACVGVCVCVRARVYVCVCTCACSSMNRVAERIKMSTRELTDRAGQCQFFNLLQI